MICAVMFPMFLFILLFSSHPNFLSLFHLLYNLENSDKIKTFVTYNLFIYVKIKLLCLLRKKKESDKNLIYLFKDLSSGCINNKL